MSSKSTPKPRILKITQIRSAIGYTKGHKATLRALGFHRLNETVRQVDSPALQGMLRKVNHFVLVEEEQETK